MHDFIVGLLPVIGPVIAVVGGFLFLVVIVAGYYVDHLPQDKE